MFKILPLLFSQVFLYRKGVTLKTGRLSDFKQKSISASLQPILGVKND